MELLRSNSCLLGIFAIPALNEIKWNRSEMGGRRIKGDKRFSEIRWQPTTVGRFSGAVVGFPGAKRPGTVGTVREARCGLLRSPPGPPASVLTHQGPEIRCGTTH